MVKRILRGSAMVFALSLLFAGCTKSGAQAAGPDTTSKALVTFVELGSVGCIPCRMTQPIMREIEGEYSGQVRVVFHDVWTEEGKPYIKKFGIRAIPTQVFLDTKASFPRNSWWQCSGQRA